MTRRADGATRALGMAVLLCVFAAAPAQATPIVVATVTPVGPSFHYDYAITFSPLDEEIALLTINLLPGDTLSNQTAPAGFFMSYDSGLGFLDLLPALSFPAFGTLSGFAFDSPRRPLPTTFDALTAISGSVLSGPTTGALGPASPIPEPVTSVLVAIGLGALGGRRAIRKHIGARS
jgi:hypothetical protein